MKPYTREATFLPWSEELEEKFTFIDRFGEKVTAFQKLDDNIIVVPRGAVVRQLDCRDEGISVKFESFFKSQKPEQPRVIKEAVALLEQDNQFVICAPTGWGKTYVGAEIAGRMGKRFCVITTKDDIVHQWVKALQETLGLAEEEIGVWRANDTPQPHHKAVVALVQSVAKGPSRYGSEAYYGFGLVLCDEVHRMGADVFSQAMWHFPSRYRIGMSATPSRRDGKDRVFKWHIGPVMVQATMEVLIPKVLSHHTGWRIPKKNGRPLFHEFGNISLLLKPMSYDITRNEIIVKYLVAALKKERASIAFSDRMEHLEIIQTLLIAAGIPEDQIGWYVGLNNPVYSGGMKTTTRMQIRESHKLRPILLATYAMASEATDIPWLDTCVLMTPKANVVQIVGRIRREYDNKKTPVVIDLVDTDGPVLGAYSGSRDKWYRKLGSNIIRR